jgi:hypothetical protein
MFFLKRMEWVSIAKLKRTLVIAVEDPVVGNHGSHQKGES